MNLIRGIDMIRTITEKARVSRGILRNMFRGKNLPQLLLLLQFRETGLNEKKVHAFDLI